MKQFKDKYELASFIQQAVIKKFNLDDWHKHYADIPSQWINGYDKGCHIERENLYNIRAIPALYLLDKDKRVLVKDSVNVGEIEAALAELTKQ